MKNVVSVIIPVYNSEKYLSECVDSVLAQSYNDLEIILVDDGSIDDSIRICNEYAKANKNIKFYKEKQSGAGAARALGVKKSIGSYIMFVDSDDYIDKYAVETITDIFSKTKADIVRFQGRYYPSERILEKINTRDEYLNLSHSKVLNMLALSDKLSSMCLQAYKRECLKGIEFAQGITYCEDYLTNQKVHEKNWKVVVTGYAPYYYRANADSTTKTSNRVRLRKNVDERVYACNKTLDFIEKNIFDDNTKNVAFGYQIDRLCSDMLKLFAKYRNKDELTLVIKEIFTSNKFRKLLRRIPYSSVNLYLSNVSLAKRAKKSIAMKAIYKCNIGRTIKVARAYRIRVGGRKWA